MEFCSFVSEEWFMLLGVFFHCCLSALNKVNAVVCSVPEKNFTTERGCGFISWAVTDRASWFMNWALDQPNCF